MAGHWVGTIVAVDGCGITVHGPDEAAVRGHMLALDHEGASEWAVSESADAALSGLIGQEGAFPSHAVFGPDGDMVRPARAGMTYRQWLVGQALAGAALAGPPAETLAARAEAVAGAALALQAGAHRAAAQRASQGA